MDTPLLFFEFPVSPVFQKVGQSHQDDGKRNHIGNLKIGAEDPRQHYSEDRTQNGPNDKNIEFYHDNNLFCVIPLFCNIAERDKGQQQI